MDTSKRPYARPPEEIDRGCPKVGGGLRAFGAGGTAERRLGLRFKRGMYAKRDSHRRSRMRLWKQNGHYYSSGGGSLTMAGGREGWTIVSITAPATPLRPARRPKRPPASRQR